MEARSAEGHGQSRTRGTFKLEALPRPARHGPVPSHPCGGGRGRGLPVTTTGQARALRRSPTDAERALWRSLRRRRFAGHKFRRQPLGDYVVDFVCLERRLVIEVDGGEHLRQVTRDAGRDEWLRGEGFRVLRFWDSDVLSQLDSVEQAIWKALENEGGRE